MKRSILCQKPSSGMFRSTAAAVATCGFALFLAVVTIPSAQGQGSEPRYTILHSFNDADGSIPQAGLVQATEGELYGTTSFGGANSGNQCGGTSCGTVFKITLSGKLTTLHSFDGRDGFLPYDGLIEATNGEFYGTTSAGGAHSGKHCGGRSCGTVFNLTRSGKLTTVHSFDGTDGFLPSDGMLQASDGKFYGTTSYGGAKGDGTIFEITAGGKLTTLHSFDGTDGAQGAAALVQAANGIFYGTVIAGGAQGDGTVFKITPSGTLTTLHNFDGTDGANPFAGLLQAVDGKFYGTTFNGGTGGLGSVFKITPSGTLTTLHSFNGSDGANPVATLVQASDGKFYGTTFSGGANGQGTIFAITAEGTLTTLHNFDGAEGSPHAGLLEDTNGKFYGTTQLGGANSRGTVFSLSLGLGPFVETLPTSGKAGAKVMILGNNLTGTSSVTFHGTAATFRVVSSSEITTTVPRGATTGTVEVMTPRGTLKSNVVFRVRK